MIRRLWCSLRFHPERTDVRVEAEYGDYATWATWDAMSAWCPTHHRRVYWTESTV
jgi:hypothetical protein